MGWAGYGSGRGREARLDAEAEAAYAAGQFVPHERVREWLKQLAKGVKVPPP
jgi:hypothetical protein